MYVENDKGFSHASCFCPFPPIDQIVHAMHWDFPCVWPYSGKELATLQGVYPEGPGQESGEYATSTHRLMVESTFTVT